MFGEEGGSALFPDYQPRQESDLAEATMGGYNRLIVDVGGGGRLSSRVRKGDIHVLVDPAAYGVNNNGNHVDAKGRVIVIQTPIEDVSYMFHKAANRVQMVAPDPRQSGNMIRASIDMVAAGGIIAVTFDRNSNLRELVRDAAKEALRLMDEAGFEVRTVGNVGRVLDGRPGTQFNLGPAIVGKRPKRGWF